jgi:cell division protein FtsL
MWWLVLILLAIAMMAAPKFGKAVLFGALVLVASVLLIVWNSTRQFTAERELARTRITPSEVEFVDLTLRPSQGTGSYTLLGRVRNRSARYALSELRVKITMRDCVAPANCETVGEVEQPMYLNVPPGQARDLNEFVHFRDLGQPRGKHEWDYGVIEIFGR